MNIWKGKYGPLLIAEIGGNHEGDFSYAKDLTILACESETDYIKFQIYTGNSLVNPEISPDRNTHFKKFELTPGQYIELADMCLKYGKGYMASVWDMNAFDWIDPYLKIYKIGSGDLTAYPYIKKIGLYGKPIIISTGMAVMSEVLETIDYLIRVNPIYKQKETLALLQCTSMYPVSTSDANLRVMNEFKKKTNYVVGYSDHTEGLSALETAYALGAEILEFHFTDTRENKSFRDHKVSLTKEEVKELSEKIKLIDQLKGTSEKCPLNIEAEHVISFRRAVYPKRSISKGAIIHAEDLKVLRPNKGIDARYFDALIGKKTKVDLIENQILDWKYFE
jgi:N-acetylneuraminate synthase/N,N'-diacetyllegionaminate synthase